MKETEEHRSLRRGKSAERAAERAIAHNPILIVAAIAALVTMVLVPPDDEYLGYFDWHTLICLFCILATLSAIGSSGLLDWVSHSIAEHVHSTRTLIVALVTVTLGCSMVLSNDMTLVTVLPLATVLLKSVHREREIPFAFIVITLTANLGGMLLPFGNPHNLYLYSIFHLTFGQFVGTMAPPLILSMVLIYACCRFVHTERFSYTKPDDVVISRKHALLYTALFVVCILMTVNVVPYLMGMAVVVAVLAIVDHEVFAKTDYALIMTFICFFIFSGNIARVPGVADFFASLLGSGAFLTTLISSQVISNVPAAILISHFSNDWAGIALGSNVGGVGTPISSLATLITLRQFQKAHVGGMGRFLGKFEVYNFAFLIVVAAFEMLVMGVR